MKKNFLFAIISLLTFSGAWTMEKAGEENPGRSFLIQKKNKNAIEHKHWFINDYGKSLNKKVCVFEQEDFLKLSKDERKSLIKSFKDKGEILILSDKNRSESLQEKFNQEKIKWQQTNLEDYGDTYRDNFVKIDGEEEAKKYDVIIDLLHNQLSQVHIVDSGDKIES